MATVRLRISPADHGRKMTLEEFREADEEEGYRYELARGVLEVTEVPNDPHGQVVSNLEGLIHRYKDRHPGVIRRVGGGGEFRLWIPEMISGRNPDVAIVFHGTPQDERGRRRPRLVAEVVSRRGENRDYREKREEYWAFGIEEYWVVDPSLRQILLLTRRGDDWVERSFQGEDRIDSGLLPGFAGTVAELWADAEDEE
jgi:Uma2 family endonuclease